MLMLTYDDLEELAQGILLEEGLEKDAGVYTGRQETKTVGRGARAGQSYTTMKNLAGEGRSPGVRKEQPTPWRAPSEEFMKSREEGVKARLAKKQKVHTKLKLEENAAKKGVLKRGLQHARIGAKKTWQLAKAHPYAAGGIAAGTLAAGALGGALAGRNKEASALDTLAFLRAQEIFAELGGDPDYLELGVEKTSEALDWDALDQLATEVLEQRELEKTAVSSGWAGGMLSGAKVTAKGGRSIGQRLERASSNMAARFQRAKSGSNLESAASGARAHINTLKNEHGARIAKAAKTPKFQGAGI
jgi:hypothetical protein